MDEILLDIVYLSRNLCELFRDLPDITHDNEEILEVVDSLEEKLDLWSSENE